MNEELLKSIIQLFAIAARERITEDERKNIREYLAVHVSQESLGYYMKYFDEYCLQKESVALADTDEETAEFIGDWAKIMDISKQINEGLTQQQKFVLVLKMIELMLADGKISEWQSNLIYYFGEAIKISQQDLNQIIKFVKADEIEEFKGDNILIVDDGLGELPIPVKRLVADKITGMIAIIRMSATETYFIKYLGISSLTLNGLPLISRTISVFPTGSTIRGNKVPPIYYSDVAGKFHYSETKSQISFVAENLSYKFKDNTYGLRKINIAEKGGKLIGLMGASGSGKSTLLNVLNGNEDPSSGRVLINEVNLHRQRQSIEGVIGFVPQDDFLIEELTVYQNMYYAAKLCFSQFSELQIEELILKTLRNLGLLEIKDVKVGSPLEKTISGGQRKRLNISLELLREPTVLFVDEPTSGLSSRDSENIMDLLKELALKGKMIFVVIHQPSSDIFKMFDSLVILDVGGYQVYYGNPVDAAVYFKNIVNMVNKDQGSCPECGNINSEQIFSIIETRIVNEYGRFTEKRKTSPEEWHEYYKERVALPRINMVKGPLRSTLQIPNRLKQLVIFTTRDLLSKLSNKQYLVINLFEAPILAIFLASLVKYYATVGVSNAQYQFSSNENIPIFFFMSIIVALFMGLTVSAEEIIKDRKILKRESFLHLSKSSYLYSKILILFGISAIQSLSFVLIGVYMLEISGMTFTYWLILFSTSCFANVLGLNISSAFNSAITIYILIPIILIPQLVLSGVVISFDKFNPKVATLDKVPLIGEIMTTRWAFEAAMVNQFKDNEFEKRFYDLEKKMYAADYKKNYYVTELQTKLSNVNRMLRDSTSNSKEIAAHFELLTNEIGKELKAVNKQGSYNVRWLKATRFDSAAFTQFSEFLSTMKKLYINRYNKAQNEIDKLTILLTKDEQSEAVFTKTRSKYQNDAIADMVKNRTTANRIVENQNRLIQIIYPIYTDPEPRHIFDFRTRFYSPMKHFAGLMIDTFWFNIIFIWFMSVILFTTLYYDVLRKIVEIFSRLPKKNMIPGQ